MNFSRLVWIALVLMVMVSGSARAQKTALGINDHFFWRTPAEQDVAFAQYAASNTKFIRADIDWFVIENPKGTFKPQYLERMDNFFKLCSDHGIRVLVSIAYAPAWANGNHAGGGWPPVNNEDFADFNEWFLKRYAPYKDSSGRRTLEAIEIWNEPNLCDLFFKGYARNAADAGTAYGNMVVATGSRLQKVRAEIGAGDVLIAAPVLSDVHGPCWAAKGKTTWMDAYYAVPKVTSAYDLFTWHSYWFAAGSTGWVPPELPPAWDGSSVAAQGKSVLGKLTADRPNELWGKMVAAGDSTKPNWCTEIGGASRADVPDHKASLLSFAEQKTHLEDILNVLNAGSVTNLKRVYWYNLFDDGGQAKSEQVYGLLALSKDNPLAYKGFIPLSKAEFTPKPAYGAYQHAEKGEGH